MKKINYLTGLKHGMPICFAYLTVSFTFGLNSVKNGLPIWFVTLVSATNLTSAGQFAGVNLIVSLASFLEIGLAVFIINSRYTLMSLSLSQRLEENFGTLKRLIISFFITDEIYAIASLKKEKVNFSYFLGLASGPYLGWVFGTLLGGAISSLLSLRLQNAMGIALYCMFIAIIIPPSKTEKPLVFCIILSAILSCFLEFTPIVSFIPMGFRIIIASVFSATISAVVFPIIPKNNSSKNETFSSDEMTDKKAVKGGEE